MVAYQCLAEAAVKAGDRAAGLEALESALRSLKDPAEEQEAQDPDGWVADCLARMASLGLGREALRRIPDVPGPNERLRACHIATLQLRERAEREKASAPAAPPKELMGVWQSGSGDNTALAEFTADGKYLLTVTRGQKVTRREGTYSAQGDQVEIRLGDGEPTRRRWRVNSDSELELHSDEGGNTRGGRTGRTAGGPASLPLDAAAAGVYFPSL